MDGKFFKKFESQGLWGRKRLNKVHRWSTFGEVKLVKLKPEINSYFSIVRKSILD